MKKFIIPVLLICLLLTACGQTPNQNSIQSSNQPTNPTTQKTPTGQNPQGMLRFARPDSYEEYCSLLDTYRDKLPWDFVTYDELSVFGRFRYFKVLQSDLDEGKVTKYTYGFLTEKGERIVIDIYCNTYASGRGFRAQVRSNDLRSFDISGLYDEDDVIRNRRYYVEIDGAFYLYNGEGRLETIYWQKGMLRLELWSVAKWDGLTPWDVEGMTPTFRNLLYADTAGTAIQSIKAAKNPPAVS